MKNNFDKILYKNAEKQLDAYTMSIVALINESIIEFNNIDNIEKSYRFSRGIEYLEIVKRILLFQTQAAFVDYDINIDYYKDFQEDEEI
ncbi:hypothetical protein [Helcococcus bovis]|uniref:hypothetical protein n=1 Tax=Helcococcus bovis TaxID=3153252 RepID=UPI0038BC7659